MALNDRVRELIAEHFAGAEIRLEDDNPTRCVGMMVWTGFSGVEQVDRQRRLAAVLREGLRPEDLVNVGVILTMTPDEIADDDAA